MVTTPERFVRVQATYRGRLGVEVGVFVAVDHLRRAGVLTAQEESAYLDVDDWFHEHLPNPDFYADGNSIGAVTWFRTPVPAAMQDRVDQMCAILRAHGVPFDVVHATDPGTRIYEDAFQVGVVPHVRGTPTPMPAGVAQAPTTAGSKRAVATSPIRHVLFAADGVLPARPDDDPSTCVEPLRPVVEALRRNGYGVHRGTSQDVGDGARFAPETALLVDDSPANVEAARAAGLTALQWAVDDGPAALVDALARHAVDARLTAPGT